MTKAKFDEDSLLENESDFDEVEEDEAKKKKLTIEEYEQSYIHHIPRGCPICRSDVSGNEHYQYFCKKCNLLFNKQQIMDKSDPLKAKLVPLSDEQKKALSDKKKALIDRMKKAFSDEKKQKVEVAHAEIVSEPKEMLPKLEMPKFEPEKIVLPEPVVETASDTESEEEYEVESEDKIIASRESTKLHKGNCHFIKKIHPENRIYFYTVTDGETKGYELCVCLRRMVARKKAGMAK